MIISHFPSGAGGGSGYPQFTYTGSYDIESDAGGWKLKLLSSGTLKMLSNATVDIFAVGSGGSGHNYSKKLYVESDTPRSVEYDYGGGGGAGYTQTVKEISLVSGREYDVVVGLLGGASSISYNNTAICSANGGDDCTTVKGGDGGTGGAGRGSYKTYENGNYRSGKKSINPATNGADGENGAFVYIGGYGGDGQGTTTREFGDADGKLYASGGGAYSQFAITPQMVSNTGDGGHGGPNATNGASGIIIIRNARA